MKHGDKFAAVDTFNKESQKHVDSDSFMLIAVSADSQGKLTLVRTTHEFSYDDFDKVVELLRRNLEEEKQAKNPPLEFEQLPKVSLEELLNGSEADSD